MGSIAKSYMWKGLQNYAKIRVYKGQSSKQNKCIMLVLRRITLSVVQYSSRYRQTESMHSSRRFLKPRDLKHPEWSSAGF